MIQASFIPPRPIRELRDLTRRRKRVVEAGTAERNRVQKILEDANVKLGNVLSDVFGASGQLMLDALLKGEATPEQIAQLAQRSARKKIPEIISALEGHRISDHHRKMIRYSLEHMRFVEEQVAELDRDIAEKIREAGLEKEWGLLQTVPGVQERSAASILAETGNDMSQFPSEKHLSSWAGVCPGNNESAGKRKGSGTTGGNVWLRTTLTECAWAAAAKKDHFLKEKFWRMAGKSGGNKQRALMAIAHTEVILIYQVLKSGQPYQDRQLSAANERQRERIIRHHIRRLGKLGVTVCFSREPSRRNYSAGGTTIAGEAEIAAPKAPYKSCRTNPALTWNQQDAL
jgi:transposase